ncbi:methyltransferase domain-containing protein [Brevibacillus reuszeri]|uniref:class I SAM-dependent methyltransferase n=1 Tax=Brevibacillus reuszeri TaxID=54915 RepID=UPI003D1A50D5
MAIVQLRSQNPDFSFLIKKNPRSGMLLRSIRKGIGYGWYTDDSTFNVYFKDADNEISYKQSADDTFEYLNVSRYNTPLFPLHAINEFFSAPLKSQDERDKAGYEHMFFINMVHVEMVHYIEFFQKHLPDYTFETKHLAHKSYSLTVTTRKTLYELLHTLSVLCLFFSMFGKEYLDISESLLDKYIKSIQVMDAPFYIRSLFARNFLTTKRLFRQYRESLEKSDRYVISLDYGSTAHQRRNYIESLFAFNKPILDIGCGEGFYAIPFAAKLEDFYYVVDTNEEALKTVSRRAEAKEMGNIISYHSISHFLEEYDGEQVDVILTEVIEHMSMDEASLFIKQIIQGIHFERLVITTPNADFNTFYELTGFRHEDHKWELGQNEFRKWLLDVIGQTELQVEFVAIGDKVNQIQTTQGVILTKRGA